MSRKYDQTVSENACSHQNTIDNERDGECVCTDCGLVLSQLYNENRFLRQIPLVSKNTMHDFIRDIGENAHIPDCIVAHALNYFDKIQKLESSKFCSTDVAAFALYESLNKFEVPRLAEEIAFFSGVKLKKILAIESNLTLETYTHDPKHYVSYFCNILNLSYANQLLIGETVDCLNEEIPLGSVRCNCLVALVIYLFCKDREKKVSLKKICETCSISATSVHRVMRQLKKFARELFKKPPLVWIAKHLEKSI